MKNDRYFGQRIKLPLSDGSNKLSTIFSIYRSSAGSGKTRTLAKEYLKLALRYPEYFRYILAMTFTNKSTQEMKDRIIRYLDDFTKGQSEDLSAEILEDFEKEGRKYTVKQLKDASQEILQLILHQYSQFSVSTIDAFFQRVIRSFTRETGLLGNFRLEVDNDMVLEEVIDLLMDELTENEELRGWVLDFSLDQLVEGKDWDIRKSLLDFSRQIFTEEFKAIEEDVLRVTEKKGFFKDFKQSLFQQTKVVENRVLGDAQKLFDEIKRHQLSVSDFKHGSRGSVYTYIEQLCEEIKLPGANVVKALEDVGNWPAPKHPQAGLIVSLASQHWLPRLTSIVEYLEKNRHAYFSASEALHNLYAFGLLADISRTLKKYLAEKNLMLLSDAPKFLSKLMEGQDTSFIYEKVGSFYRHYLIDEFQDTSGFQWKNLLPLIKNGTAQNYKSLIVGDIKQSIYRWRGGDLKILQEKVKNDVGAEIVDTFPLGTNYRSAGNIVNFNNALFSTAAKVVSSETGTAFPQEAYLDAAQKNYKWPNQGYVSIQFMEAQKNEGGKVSFEALSLEALPKVLENLQQKGVPLRDIAFLVRDNRDGQKIARHFMQYRSSGQAKEGCRYDVVSNESLRLDQASSVHILVNAMRLLENPTNEIANADLAYENSKLWPAAFPDHHKTFAKSHTRDFAGLMPPAFTTQHHALAALPLLELVENLILIFNLGKLPTEIAYLQAFQDLVLEFTAREKSDLTSFLQWWDDNKEDKSIQVAGGVDAARIITIHKSKGLQFKFVIIPFLEWELNHKGQKAPILWCKSDEVLFKDAGFLPLKYTGTLEQTYFKDYYAEERKRIYLDNLNLLYVAFTRAEEGLIAHAPITNSKNISSVDKLVKHVIDVDAALSPHWSEQKNNLTIGEIEVLKKDPQTSSSSLVLRTYPVVPWRERLQIRTQGKEFFSVTDQRQKINYGIFLHTLMSRIRVKEDLVSVISQAVLEGLIREEEQGSITEAVQWIVSHPDLAQSFAEGSTLKTEVSLLMPGGSERRIDRISILDNRALLIDYKTGVVKKEDEVQVREYKSILLSMGLAEVKTFLVYVNERKCVEI